ncbi:cytochrome oxidase maturation protein, cbb3-type [Halobacteriovorax marinus]|uniref:Nitrogen fixation related protein n=1 Tax=Halobacteriovorax marinus (strain ATCC BAA-682 / DSM 15412 / SJ) TaxID=862908 RepID=E1X038_HALMS|nr:cbb3-type cytochrome oxidase assembly protein CcoS [Halobacteriovorax marinus]ATH07629.1 cytochrome oxidase maturation protein, cbb3-type [Halobacteriovorax marinus]CBW26265.1 putative nitrogen fixation related protein [Halobacteriovorax marinus SJ]
MNILYLLVPLALLLGVFFVGAFIWATKKGQFDDLDTPAARIVLDDDLIRNKNITERKGRKE